MLTGQAGDYLLLLIDMEPRFVEARTGTGLPAGIIRHGSYDRHLVVFLALEQDDPHIGITLVD